MWVFAFFLLAGCAASGADLKGVYPANAAKPIGPYTPGIDAGDFIYVSGQGANTASADIATQTRETLNNVKTILEAAGVTMGHVVQAEVYLTDVKHYDAVNKVYAEFFPADPPARSEVVVAALPGITKVEITVTAIHDAKKRRAYSIEPPVVPVSDAVQAGDRVYLSGVPAISLAKGAIPDSPTAQVRGLLKRMSAVLAKANLGLRHLAFAQVYIDRSVPMKVLGKLLTDELSSETAVSVIQTEALPRGAHIQINGVASRDTKRLGDCTSVGDTLYCGSRSGPVEQALQGVSALMESTGMDLRRVVATHVYVDTIKNFETMNKAYAGAFGKSFPARTTVQPTREAQELNLAPSTDSPPPVKGSPRVHISAIAVR
jgi:2-iminobutanoate/2-iminopropanoate deaminase